MPEQPPQPQRRPGALGAAAAAGALGAVAARSPLPGAPAASVSAFGTLAAATVRPVALPSPPAPLADPSAVGVPALPSSPSTPARPITGGTAPVVSTPPGAARVGAGRPFPGLSITQVPGRTPTAAGGQDGHVEGLSRGNLAQSKAQTRLLFSRLGDGAKKHTRPGRYARLPERRT